MKAIGLVPGTTTVRLIERPEPRLVTPDQIKLRVLQVGICGTDREEVSGGRSMAPDGQGDLVIGHEMLGQVVSVGPAVTRVAVGDYAVFTARRSCGMCQPCAMNRSDMCATGNYREPGIWGLDGFQCEYVVDREQYVVKLPAELRSIGVLTEPTAVVEKAVAAAVAVQVARLPDASVTPNWLQDRRCVVVGLGPIGLLAALVLRLRGATVFGLDVVDATSTRARWLTAIGGTYIDNRQQQPGQFSEAVGPIDVIIEAAGVAALQLEALRALDYNGIAVLVGIPHGDTSLQLAAESLLRGFVLGNGVLIGSVNAARGHFQLAVDDLHAAQRRWGDVIGKLITHRYAPSEVHAALAGDDPEVIKAIIEWQQ